MFMSIIAAVKLAVIAPSLVAQIFLPITFAPQAPAPMPVVEDSQQIEVRTIDASYSEVDADGNFTIVAGEFTLAGCLATIDYIDDYPTGIIPSNCATEYEATPNLELFEDGSMAWDYEDPAMTITACILPAWGCSASSSRTLTLAQQYVASRN